MKWIEIIRLRAMNPLQQVTVLELLHQLRAELSTADATCTGYQHTTIVTDVSIHLAWRSEMPTHGKSELGVKLAYLLREFGAVEHSVWVEKLSL